MSTYTITFCERAENHSGMQMIGELAEEGFSFDDLNIIQAWFDDAGTETELLDLNNVSGGKGAFLLIVRNGLDYMVYDGAADRLEKQLSRLDWDKKAFMYGRVVNKHARHNLCFADFDQEPDYESKKGRVINFNDKSISMLKRIRRKLSTVLEDKCDNLVAEGNFYYDVSKCGVGYHGDAERKIVVGIRIGETIPLVYQWYKNNEKVGKRMRFKINHGDIYFMSEKASGNDWKTRKNLTIRHAAGSDKFIN